MASQQTKELSDNASPAKVEEAPFVRPRNRRRREDTEMDITPMIDVTFLLLIFFIVASRLDPQKSVDLPTAKHGGAIPEKACVVIILARGSGTDVMLYAGDSKDPKNLVTGDLAEQDERIADYVKNELQNNTSKNQVLIMAEKGIKSRDWHRVYMAAGKVLLEGQPIHVATIEER